MTDFPVVIAVIALVIFMIFIGVPLLIFLVETLLVIPILLVTGLVTRIFWGRPWDIEATSALASERRAVWRVAGWRASDRAAARMISVLRASGDVASETPADLVVPSALRRPVR